MLMAEKKCNSPRDATAAGCNLMVPSEVEAEKSKVYSKNKIPPREAQTGRIVFCRNEDKSLGGQVEVSRDQVWRRRQQAVQSYGFPSLLSAFRGADLAKPTLPLAGCGRHGGLVVTHTLPASGDGWVERHSQSCERHRILRASHWRNTKGLQSSCILQLCICGCEMCGAGPCPATCWAGDGLLGRVGTVRWPSL